jgi:Cu(I)/Ag(I) efflux system membrane fusion protein
MKWTNRTAGFFFTLALLAAPMAGFSAQPKGVGDGLPEPAKSVLEHYVAIQKELAKDSMKDVGENATAIAKAVNAEETKKLSPEIAKQAETVAQAKDIKKAREAFKPLSESLVKYVAETKAGKGTYHEAYCPMAKASWLQTEKEVRNPYYGKAMLDCGTLKN